MEPILLDFPEQITSRRIYIRPCLPGDGAAVHAAMVASLAELKPWMPWAHEDVTIADSEISCRLYYAKFITKEDIRLHIYRTNDNLFLGAIGLHRFDWNAGRFEIGYWIDSRYANQGYTTEAVDILTKFAFHFLEANRLEIRCDSANLGSRRIAEKSGFTLEGVLKNDTRSVTGNLTDTCVYAKTRIEFFRRNDGIS